MTHEECLEILKQSRSLPANIVGKYYTIYSERSTLVGTTLCLYRSGFIIASIKLAAIKSVKISQGSVIIVFI